jgi:flagellar biosynthesis regulator FlaF
MPSTKTSVADAQVNRHLEVSMEDAIAGYLRARDQLQQGMDGLDAYAYATNVLYVAFIQDIGITDRRVLCRAFQAFRQSLIRQHNPKQEAIHITTFQ